MDVYIKKRWKVLPSTKLVESYVKEIPCPPVIMTYFSGSGAIDVHNHTRQGTLALEENVTVHDCFFRYFCTILGIIVTNSWKGKSYFRPFLGAGSPQEPFKEYADVLCCLMTGFYDRVEAQKPKRRAPGPPPSQFGAGPMGGVK